MKFLHITDGKMSEIESAGKLEDLQALVGGGLIEAAFTFPANPKRPDGRQITAYVNEEGLLNGMEPEVNVILPTEVWGSPFQYVYMGPMVITALTPSGNTAGLTDAEIARFKLSDIGVVGFQRMLFTVPTLEVAA